MTISERSSCVRIFVVLIGASITVLLKTLCVRGFMVI